VVPHPKHGNWVRFCSLSLIKSTPAASPSSFYFYFSTGNMKYFR
jgi:hypothetical protein